MDQRIEVHLDDKKMELPSIESIVVLNIPSWGAGVDLWNMNLEGKSIEYFFFNIISKFFEQII